MGQLQGARIKGIYGLQLVVGRRHLQRLLYDQGISEVRIGLTICLQGAEDYFIVFETHVGFLQQASHQSDDVGSGGTVAPTEQGPHGFRQYDIRNENMLTAFE